MEKLSDKRAARARWRDGEFQRSNDDLFKRLSEGLLVLNSGDLAGISIGSDGPVPELWNVNLYKSSISNVDMRFSKISCSLSESIIEKTNFSQAEFDRCLMKSAEVKSSSFSGTRLVVNMDDSIYEDCDFSLAKFLGGKSGFEYGGRRVKFVRCNFSGAVFKGVEFRASRFLECSFDGTLFISCDLRGVRVDCGVPPCISQFEKMDIPDWARPEE